LKHTTERTLEGQMPTYRDPALPIMPQVVAAIARWILALKGR